MKSLRSLPALGAFFVAIALAVAGCGGSSTSVPDNSVAVMAGNPITTQAFNHWMYVAAQGQAANNPGSPVIVPTDPPEFKGCIKQVRQQLPSLKKTSDKTLKVDCQQLFTSLSGQVMDFLIKAYWYQAEAHQQGVKVTDAQVTQQIDAAKKSQFSTDAQFQQFLKSSGQTLQDLNFRERINELFTKLTARHNTPVTAAAIANYYNLHKGQFGTAESRDMRVVLTKTQAQAQAAKAALQSGHSWEAVAKQYSIDPTTKNSGGLLTRQTAGELDSTLSKAAFSAPQNKLLGPIKGQFGYYVLEVTKITPATQQTLAQATKLIRETLTSQHATAAETTVANHAQSAWKKHTECRAPYAMADCNGYKAPASASGTNTVAP